MGELPNPCDCPADVEFESATMSAVRNTGLIAKTANEARGKLVWAAVWICISVLWVAEKWFHVVGLHRKGAGVGIEPYFLMTIWAIGIVFWTFVAVTNWRRFRRG